MTAWVAIVTILVLLFYVWTSVSAGRLRGKHGIVAPAMVGHPEFERAIRVQMNTLEWMVVFLPGMWLFAAYVNPLIAALLGVVWIAGRYLYMQAYMKEPGTRTIGFMTQMIATAIAVFGGLIGAVVSLFTAGAGAGA
jgi:glutathione S-transferase